jgi:hypothetical protein
MCCGEDPPSQVNWEMKSEMSVASLFLVANRPTRPCAELQEEIRNSLRAQDPEWVKPNGESLLVIL